MKKIEEKLTLLQVILAFCMGINTIACLLAFCQKNWVSSILNGGVVLVFGFVYFYVLASRKELTNQIEERREDD